MKNKYTKEEFGQFKQDIIILDHQVKSKADNIRKDINIVINKLSKYKTAFVDEMIKELEIPIQGSDYETLVDYERDFFYTLPRIVIFEDKTINFHYIDYDNFGGFFTITVDDKELENFNELVNYLGQHYV